MHCWRSAERIRSPIPSVHINRHHTISKITNYYRNLSFGTILPILPRASAAHMHILLSILRDHHEYEYISIEPSHLSSLLLLPTVGCLVYSYLLIVNVLDPLWWWTALIVSFVPAVAAHILLSIFVSASVYPSSRRIWALYNHNNFVWSVESRCYPHYFCYSTQMPWWAQFRGWIFCDDGSRQISI